ncbi:GatB/YqeY domain-containing protein [Glaciecola sp. MH2013]|uniref:GatB/YqeY domain-containing protein n=1 Tax=Glaciecola sp. MH2013 TaxID=2785524 RepID=UPI00189EFA3C|nr:GatB/YqeY domain-containing protein [Glaciecola sp. MH2013]MBF7071923.1 GatB/YqeY domain-containing protein [Glaciecola sp. MH2013]
MTLLESLKEAQKNAMRAKDKDTLKTLRMALAAVKQREVDERIELNDTDVLAIITKMVKQRNESITQFKAANRQDLVDVEEAEIAVLQGFLPQALTQDEINALIDQAMAETGAATMQDMGKVMGWLKPKVTGRADMGSLSASIKAKLN